MKIPAMYAIIRRVLVHTESEQLATVYPDDLSDEENDALDEYYSHIMHRFELLLWDSKPDIARALGTHWVKTDTLHQFNVLPDDVELVRCRATNYGRMWTTLFKISHGELVLFGVPFKCAVRPGAMFSQFNQTPPRGLTIYLSDTMQLPVVQTVMFFDDICMSADEIAHHMYDALLREIESTEWFDTFIEFAHGA